MERTRVITRSPRGARGTGWVGGEKDQGTDIVSLKMHVAHVGLVVFRGLGLLQRLGRVFCRD